MESCRLTRGKDVGQPIAHSLSVSFLTHCVTILQCTVEQEQLDNALSCIITLQVGVAEWVWLVGVASFIYCPLRLFFLIF